MRIGGQRLNQQECLRAMLLVQGVLEYLLATCLYRPEKGETCSKEGTSDESDLCK
jgi:hypothetical protein